MQFAGGVGDVVFRCPQHGGALGRSIMYSQRAQGYPVSFPVLVPRAGGVREQPHPLCGCDLKPGGSPILVVFLGKGSHTLALCLRFTKDFWMCTGANDYGQLAVEMSGDVVCVSVCALVEKPAKVYSTGPVIAPSRGDRFKATIIGRCRA